MSRRVRFITLIGTLVLVTLACNAVTQPINQAEEIASTVQSIATAMPVETIMAIPSILPSEMPNLDLTPGTNVPDMFNPKSEPLKDWNGIPVMPQAIAGEENSDLYYYTIKAKPEEVKTYYDAELKKLGWESFAGMGESSSGGLFLIYQKSGETLSIVVTPAISEEGVLLVMITKG